MGIFNEGFVGPVLIVFQNPVNVVEICVVFLNVECLVQGESGFDWVIHFLFLAVFFYQTSFLVNGLVGAVDA